MRILSARLSSNPAFEPRPHSLENRAPIAQPKSRTSVRQTERVLLRTSFAQGLCARPLRTTFAHLLFPISLLFTCGYVIVHGRFQCCTRGGVQCCTGGGIQCCTREGAQCCTRGGQNGGSDPPVCALRAALTPGCIAHHVGQCRPPYRGVAPAIVILAGRLGLRRARAA